MTTSSISTTAAPTDALTSAITAVATSAAEAAITSVVKTALSTSTPAAADGTPSATDSAVTEVQGTVQSLSQLRGATLGATLLHLVKDKHFWLNVFIAFLGLATLYTPVFKVIFGPHVTAFLLGGAAIVNIIVLTHGSAKKSVQPQLPTTSYPASLG